MKIISVDNFDRESHNHPDREIVRVHNESVARQIVSLLNLDEGFRNNLSHYTDTFYKAVNDEYVLRKFDPNGGAL